jgi:hypothetical protein
MWLHIGASPTTGVTPVVGAVWQLTSVGQLAHAQNSDTYLAFGTATEVSAGDLFVLVNTQLASVTLSAFNTARLAGTLLPNRTYFITDMDWLIKTNDATYPAMDGIAIKRVPRYDTLTRWSPSTVFASGLKVIYSGVVYNHATGTNTATTPDADSANWTPVISSNNTYYRSIGVPMRVTADFTTVAYYYDRNGNAYPLGGLGLQDDNDSFVSNNIDSGSIIYGDTFYGSGYVSENKLSNQSTLFVNTGNVRRNVLQKANLYLTASVGDVLDSVFINTDLTCDLVSGRSINQAVFMNCGAMTFPGNQDYSGSYILGIRNKAASLSITGVATTLDLTAFIAAQLDHAQFLNGLTLTSTNATESISKISGVLFAKYYPEDGLDLTVTTTAVASLSANNQIISDSAAGAHVLKGSRGDYLEIVGYVTLGGFSVVNVKLHITT